MLNIFYAEAVAVFEEDGMPFPLNSEENKSDYLEELKVPPNSKM